MGQVTQEDGKFVNKYILAKSALGAKTVLKKVIQKKAPINLLFDSDKEVIKSLRNLPFRCRIDYKLFKVTLR